MKKKRILSIVLMMAAVLMMSLNTQAAAKISKKNVTLIKGQTIKLKITGTKTKAKWDSNKKKVASVTQKGIVKARAKGSAVVSAKIGDKIYKCNIKVETPRMSKSSATVYVGSKLKLKLNGTTQKIKWKSSNKKAATVSGGVITARKPGRTVISATVLKKKFTCKITVKDIAVKSVSLDKTSLIVEKGAKAALQASYLPLDATVDTTVTWKSSNESVATVSNGIISGLKAGEATITAKIGKKTAKCYVLVNETFGSVSGNVTYYYNSYRGNVADAGAYVFLFPADMSAVDTYDSLSVYSASSDLTAWHIYSTKVDGTGNYTINNIPTGSYRVVIVSNKTSAGDWFDAYDDALEDAPESFYQEIAQYFEWFIGEKAAYSLADSIAFRKWTYEDIMIHTNTNTTFSYDFGITYI